MPRRLPSLNGLRAFEAAVRLGGLTRAAAELNVTQAAVSRMVRLLEEGLGFPLFERRANAVVPNERGRFLGPEVTRALDALEIAVRKTVELRADPTLVVGVGATFALRLLIPRLPEFHARHPEIEARVATGGSDRPIRDDWTCAVSLGTEPPAGFERVALLTADLVPVRAPNGNVPFDGIPTLHNTAWADDWPRWRAAVGATTTPARSLFFPNYEMTLRAALDGVGVALAPLPYVADDLAVGRLVRAHPRTVPMNRTWFLVWRPEKRDDPALIAFRNWLPGAIAA